jgi:hypothetical protein
MVEFQENLGVITSYLVVLSLFGRKKMVIGRIAESSWNYSAGSW